MLSNALAGRVLFLLALSNPVAIAQLLQPCTLQQADYALVKVDSSQSADQIFAWVQALIGMVALQLLDGRHYLLRVRRISVEHKGLLQKALVRFAELSKVLN